jgi:hypothetical protein
MLIATQLAFCKGILVKVDVSGAILVKINDFIPIGLI